MREIKTRERRYPGYEHNTKEGKTDYIIDILEDILEELRRIRVLK